MRNRSGFTLIELLVYIVIAAIIVGIAGQVFYDATVSRLRTTRLLESSMGSTDVLTYLQEDIRRTGNKARLEIQSSSSTASSSSGATGIKVVSAVYWAPSATPSDSSSFNAVTSGTAPNRLDEIQFRSSIYDATTKLVIGWEQVRYHVQGGALWRVVVSRKDLTGADLGTLPSPVKMADSVVAFQLRYGVQSQDSVIFARDIVEPCVASSSTSSCIIEHTTTGVSPVAKSGNPELGPFPGATPVIYFLTQAASPTSPESFEVKPGVTYEVSLDVSCNQVASEDFRADQDYLAIRIAPDGDPTTNVDGTTDVLYYADLNQNMSTRTFEFSPAVTDDANIALVFQIRSLSSTSSAMAGAAFRYSHVEVRAKADKAYDWKDSFGTTADELRLKRRVRAIEMSISTRFNRAITTTKKVIPVPNNGV